MHLHLLDQLPRHLVSFILLLGLVLEMAPDYVEDLIFESEAVAKTALVSYSRQHQILALGKFV